MTIQAIQTRYLGHEFRSRLEARWACFFTALGIPWHYEPEGYDLEPGVRYLPDFYLPSIDTFYEVKGESPTQEAEDKAALLGEGLNKRVLIAYGAIGAADLTQTVDEHSGIRMIWPAWDTPYLWCQCEHCGKYGIEFNGWSGRICTHPGQNEKGFNAWFENINILNAYDKARSERFGT